MIVRQFIGWIRTAPAGERAEATRALARAWLISDLSAEDRAAAEGALLIRGPSDGAVCMGPGSAKHRCALHRARDTTVSSC